MLGAAHRRLRDKLASISAWASGAGLAVEHEASHELGILTSGVSVMHVLEAVPEVGVLELRLMHPLPFDSIRRFRDKVQRCLVIEEGDP